MGIIASHLWVAHEYRVEASFDLDDWHEFDTWTSRTTERLLMVPRNDHSMPTEKYFRLVMDP